MDPTQHTRNLQWVTEDPLSVTRQPRHEADHAPPFTEADHAPIPIEADHVPTSIEADHALSPTANFSGTWRITSSP
jgi:hypothetical protein